MFVGKVIGSVWSTVKWPELVGHKLLLVRPYHLAELKTRHAAPAQAATPSSADSKEQANLGTRETVVCIDLLDAGIGDDVVVAFGHAARVAAEAQPATASSPASASTAPTTPIDAAIVAIVDNYSL